MTTAVLLSGGVDSSVALHLVAEAAREAGEPPPVAFYLKIWLEDELAHLGHCPWEDDLRFASEVCRRAGVKLEVIPMQRRYHDLVVSWALDELRAGRTPSPDVLCNRRVKFGAFLDLLDELGDFPNVASGHYAGLDIDSAGRVRLLRGIDPVKDQTYFLFRLDQRQLRRARFPLGEMQKEEVRRQAGRLGLPNRDRPDSQGICFLGKLRFEDFVRAHLGERPGPIRDIEDGRELGEHLGHWFFTIGQRKGLRLGGGPWYVVDKDPVRDTVWVTHARALAAHERRSFALKEVSWIAGDAPGGFASTGEPARFGVRLRHGPAMARARLASAPGEAQPGDRISVRLEQADPGVAPGQVAVLYRDRICLGGGQIALPTPPDGDHPLGR
ncbi:MAG: tRNA 2-thiouridine(34) synthase MnmA [Holophagales bacterium]|nr:tRNA 2-thiouridine(34) synthase MnmA [Holophagales bacterium]